MERFQGFERWLASSEEAYLDGSSLSPTISAQWFQAIYDSALVFSGVLAADGRVIDANRLSVEGCGLVRNEVLGTPFWECGWWAPSPDLAARIRKWCSETVATGRSFRAITRYFRGDGSVGMVDLGLDPVTGSGASNGTITHLIATGLDISDVLAAQAAREDAIHREAATSREAEERFRGALDAMIDHVAIARSVRTGAGEIEDFELEYANRASVDGAGRPISQLAGQRVCSIYPSWRSSGMFELFVKVVETGEPFVGERLAYEDVLADGTPISGYWDMRVAKLDDGYIAASRDVTQAVLDEEVVRRARALAEGERIAVDVLQQAALPAVLPQHPAVRIGVHYQPAAGHTPVGGDWYDVFELGPDRIGLVIADVAGHGPEAAAFMVQLRNVLRTVALECGEPRESLERLNHVALSLREPTPLTTCCFAVADLAAHQLSWALAGHPPAVVCALDGTTSLLGAPPGLPLGVAEDAVYRTCTAPISPGDRLVFYTDGLIERRDEVLDEGIERLCRGLAQSRDLPPASAATWLAASVSPRLDDVALIVMDVGPQL